MTMRRLLWTGTQTWWQWRRAGGGRPRSRPSRRPQPHRRGSRSRLLRPLSQLQRLLPSHLPLWWTFSAWTGHPVRRFPPRALQPPSLLVGWWTPLRPQPAPLPLPLPLPWPPTTPLLRLPLRPCPLWPRTCRLPRPPLTTLSSATQHLQRQLCRRSQRRCSSSSRSSPPPLPARCHLRLHCQWLRRLVARRRATPLGATPLRHPHPRQLWAALLWMWMRVHRTCSPAPTSAPAAAHCSRASRSGRHLWGSHLPGWRHCLCTLAQHTKVGAGGWLLGQGMVRVQLLR